MEGSFCVARWLLNRAGAAAVAMLGLGRDEPATPHGVSKSSNLPRQHQHSPPGLCLPLLGFSLPTLASKYKSMG